ncbi:MAG: radical SAM protein [Planctomycetota bacterium]
MRQRQHLNLADRINAGVPFKPARRELYTFEAAGRLLTYDVNAMTLVAGKLGAQGAPVSCFRPDFPHPGASEHVRHLVLYLTRRCNLRCHYCFVPHTDEGKSARMSSDTARRAIEVLLPAHRSVTIAFFGGEPLLEWDRLTEVVEFAKQVYSGPGRPHFEVTTNGTLLDPAKVAFLDREGFDLMVSLDGPKDIHDRHRQTASGEGSYDDAIAGLSQLRGRRLATRTTLQGIFTPGAMRLRDRLEHHHQLIDDGLCAHVSLEPVFETDPDCAPNPAKAWSFSKSAVDWEAVEGEYQQAARYLADRVRKRRRASFEQLVRFVRRLAYRRPVCSECEAGNGYASVAPDGTIYACHREGRSAIGDLAVGGIDESLRAKWLDNRFYLSLDCLDCPIRFVCGGHCRQEALEWGHIHAPTVGDCRFRYIAFRWAAWLLSELSREGVARLVGQRASTCCGQEG